MFMFVTTLVFIFTIRLRFPSKVSIAICNYFKFLFCQVWRWLSPPPVCRCTVGPRPPSACCRWGRSSSPPRLGCWACTTRSPTRTTSPAPGSGSVCPDKKPKSVSTLLKRSYEYKLFQCSKFLTVFPPPRTC